MKPNQTTNLTELAYVFADQKKIKAAPVKGIAARFWMPGDTYEQALARSEAAFAEIEAKLDAKIAARGERT
jgi:hypothetical protein